VCDTSDPHGEIQLTHAEWGNVPESSGRWHEYNGDADERLKRERILREVVPVIIDIISFDLTPRQKQVMDLCFLQQKTQVEAAATLGATQPTVSQHLYGKRRNGKKVGGAIRKIRKGIVARAIKRNWCPEGDEVVAILLSLLDKRITRRKAAELLGTLG
jgi:predicted transcriptional regulator